MDIENETGETSRQQDLLFAAALSLVVAVVLVLLGAVLRSGTFHGASARSRLELISGQSANVVTAAFLLGAVVALSFLTWERIERARPIVVVTLIVGTVIAFLAAYTVVDLLTVHIPGPNSEDIVSIGLSSNGASAADRLGSVLPSVGAVFIAVVALVGANRLGTGTSGSPESGDDRRDLPEVE